MTDLITTKEAAEILDVEPVTLRQWRNRKLFGCVFFAADERRGKKWYYERERVLQLKSVYQKGVLADLVKLSKENANTFLHDGRFTPSTIITGKKFTVTNPGQHHGLFSAADVAKIFGVALQTVFTWTQRGQLRWDKYDHANKLLFKAEDIEAFARRRNKGGLIMGINLEAHGYKDVEAALPDVSTAPETVDVDKKTTPAEADAENQNVINNSGVDSITNDQAPQQNLATLPNEISSLPRFFNVNADKVPIVKAWSNPDNQRPLSSLRGLVGFDTCGHERGADYLLLDFDHVLDDQGQFVNADAREWFELIHSTLKGYCELSISGHGLHILAKPSPDKFQMFSGGRRGTLHFGNGAKLELFYRSAGRYCLLTGNLFQCEPHAPIAGAAEADEVLDCILDEIAKRNATAPENAHEPTSEKSAPTTNHQPTQHFDEAEYDLFRARIMLNCIDCTALEDSDWLAVNSACKNIGLSYQEVDAFNRSDPDRYNETENLKRWNSTTDPSYDIETLHGIAKRFHYKEKSARKEWYQLHPELSKKSDKSAQIDSLKAQLKEATKALADFNAEKDAALEKLRDVETFDSETVFSEEILTAVAFARVFDKKAFSDFKRDVKIYGDKHPNEKASVNDWLADVKYRAAEITKRREDLGTCITKIKAQIDSLYFIAANESLKGIVIPEDYSLTQDGVEKVAGDFMITVCRRPVIITGKTFSADEKIYKLTLAYMTTEGKWKTLPATEAATVFNHRKIVDLANTDLPVTSTNANLIVDYLDAFKAENENNFRLTYSVPRCGWHSFGGKDYFVDPRRNCSVTEGEKNISVKVDSQSRFAQSLRQAGSIEAWKTAYQLAKKSPVARLIVAASIAPPLLKILGERNFLLYIIAPTRAGKTTALYLGASAVGSEKMIRSFDATKNGLVGAAADVSDYAFLVDEKQVADDRIKEQFSNLVYALANGVGRTRLNRDSTLKPILDWCTIAIMTGETQMLPDNSTGGAFTRLLTVAVSKKEILAAATCKEIRNTIAENYGHAFPLVVDKILEFGKTNLRGWYQEVVEAFTETFPELLPEYCRYMAVLTIADGLLNSVLGKKNALDDATLAMKQIVPMIPTTAEISDTPRERDFVISFVAQNQGRFIGGNIPLERMQAPIFGKLNDADDDYIYVETRALQVACQRSGFDYRKLVADLIADGFFVPDDKIEKDRRKPRPCVLQRLGKQRSWCYRYKNTSS